MKFKHIGLVLIFCFFSLSIKSQISTRQSMLADFTVQKGLSAYLEKIPVSHESYFGFSNRDEFEKVEFGEPLQIFTVNYDSIETVSKAIHKSSLWYIPLIVDTSYRCFLHVRQNNKSFQVVGIGLMEVARDLDTYERIHNLKQIQNKALLFDQVSNILCLVSDIDVYYPIRALPKCSGCNTDKDLVYNRVDFLSRIRIYD